MAKFSVLWAEGLCQERKPRLRTAPKIHFLKNSENTYNDLILFVLVSTVVNSVCSILNSVSGRYNRGYRTAGRLLYARLHVTGYAIITKDWFLTRDFIPNTDSSSIQTFAEKPHGDNTAENTEPCRSAGCSYLHAYHTGHAKAQTTLKFCVRFVSFWIPNIHGSETVENRTIFPTGNDFRHRHGHGPGSTENVRVRAGFK
jgi:hypothetical protein